VVLTGDRSTDSDTANHFPELWLTAAGVWGAVGMLFPCVPSDDAITLARWLDAQGPLVSDPFTMVGFLGPKVLDKAAHAVGMHVPLGWRRRRSSAPLDVCAA
jgi:hypothetical protein